MVSIGEIKRLPTTTCEFEWIIPNFFSLSKKTDECYFSPPFWFAGKSCNLSIAPNGYKSQDSVGYIGLYLTRSHVDSTFSPEVFFSIKTLDGILTSNLETQLSEKVQPRHYEKYETDHSHEEIYGISRYFSRSELLKKKSEMLPSNVLTVLCTVKYLMSAGNAEYLGTAVCCFCEKPFDPESISAHEKECRDRPIRCQPARAEDFAFASFITTAECSYCQKMVKTENIPLHEKKCMNKPIKCPECSIVTPLHEWYGHECQAARVKGETSTSESHVFPHDDKVLLDFKDLFLKKEDCDVIIKVQGQEFPVHKVILKARSSVLASTFSTNMKEKATGVLEIDDCDPSFFSDFLCFLYCGDVGVISKENVFSLFTVADKYDVQELRAKCTKVIKEILSVDTFCDTITLALRHSETELMKLTTEFFTKNAPKIIVTVKWQIFLQENPTQSNELLIKLLVNNQSSSK